MLFSTLFRAALALCAAAALAQTPTHLLVTSTTVDTARHKITFQLKNTAKVPAVAWVLRVTQTDANTRIVVALNSGEENVYAFAYPDDPEEEQTLATGFIQPNQTITRTWGADPRTVHAQVTILAVVYADRKAEGNDKEINMIFAGRAEAAKQMAEVAASPDLSAKAMAEHTELKTPPMARAQALELQSRRAQ